MQTQITPRSKKHTMMLKTFTFYPLLFLAFAFSACSDSATKKGNATRYAYPDILDLRADVRHPLQESISSFSDLGTWHSFSLNKTENTAAIGSFAGPYLMRQQESFWLSPAILKLQIKDTDSGKIIDFSQAKEVKNTFYPGLLQQSFSIEDFEIILHLFSGNERTSLITAEVTNTGTPRNVQVGWSGTVFENTTKSIEKTSNGIKAKLNDEECVQLIFNGDVDSFEDSCYSYFEKSVALPNAAKFTVSAALVYTFSQKEAAKYEETGRALLNKTEEELRKNEKRWNSYLTQLLTQSDDALLDVKAYDKLAVKSLITLMHNWRSAAGSIYHQGIIPSYSANYFQGLWAWDSWKHAVAIAPFEHELAKDQIRAMYDYQNENGMIADCFFRDLNIEEVNWRNTKAPLSGWSIFRVYELTQDLDFLKEMYPKLIKYHEWWYDNRDHDGNKLCEYGSTDGTRIAAAWESGMDNAVRFDNALILKNNDEAFSLNQESVDLNAYLYREKVFLQKMADILNDAENKKKYTQEAKTLKDLIKNMMYCPEDGYFYDIALQTNKKINIQGPEGWSPLYNHVASKQQAEKVIELIMDTSKFNTAMPFPTLSAAHEAFNPQKGYWRGPVWLDQAYFAIKGMQHYGFEKEARMMAKKLVNSAEGLADTQAPIRENYHPITKEGLNAYNFSWSAAHILMLF